MSSYLILNSEDKQSGTNSDAKYRLNGLLSNVNNISLSSFEFDYNVKNININNYESVFMDDGISSSPVLLLEGWYSYEGLAQAIEDGLNNSVVIGTPFTVSYSTDDNNYTITCASFPFTLRKLTTGRSWLEMIDLEPDLPLELSHVGGSNLNINYTNKIYITSQEIHQDKIRRDVSTTRNIADVLGIVYVNSNAPQKQDKNDAYAPASIYPKFISNEYTNPKTIRAINGLETIDIILYDDYGLKMPDELNYSLTFLIS